mmetsp:Transcript_54969/g.169400  ORF Transcript_54969/g.169400 Transcript_54969/m.169400 type:complete len:251 (-) Transcript_54969:19-771(-)
MFSDANRIAKCRGTRPQRLISASTKKMSASRGDTVGPKRPLSARKRPIASGLASTGSSPRSAEPSRVAWRSKAAAKRSYVFGPRLYVIHGRRGSACFGSVGVCTTAAEARRACRSLAAPRSAPDSNVVVEPAPPPPLKAAAASPIPFGQAVRCPPCSARVPVHWHRSQRTSVRPAMRARTGEGSCCAWIGARQSGQSRHFAMQRRQKRCSHGRSSTGSNHGSRQMSHSTYGLYVPVTVKDIGDTQHTRSQ